MHYDGFSTLYVVIFPVEVLSTDQARIYLQKSAGREYKGSHFSSFLPFNHGVVRGRSTILRK